MPYSNELSLRLLRNKFNFLFLEAGKVRPLQNNLMPNLAVSLETGGIVLCVNNNLYLAQVLLIAVWRTTTII